jgi:hypothetical protein
MTKVTESQPVYLEIKNWEKYQADNKGQVREGPSPWIKDWTDKESDYEYSKLTYYQRYVYDALRRLKGKTGKNPPNDPLYIARATHALPRDSAHIAHAIRTLIDLGLVRIVWVANSNSHTTHALPTPSGSPLESGDRSSSDIDIERDRVDIDISTNGSTENSESVTVGKGFQEESAL